MLLYIYICVCDIYIYIYIYNIPSLQEASVQSLGQEDPKGGNGLPTPVFLPGEFHGQRGLAGYIPQGHLCDSLVRQD